MHRVKLDRFQFWALVPTVLESTDGEMVLHGSESPDQILNYDHRLAKRQASVSQVQSMNRTKFVNDEEESRCHVVHESRVPGM